MKPINMLAVLLICTLSTSLPVQPSFATLADMDWQNPGDTKLMLDTDTGPQWLDLSVTANHKAQWRDG